MTRMVRALCAIAVAAALGGLAGSGEPTWESTPGSVTASPGEPTWESASTVIASPGEPTWESGPADVDA